MGILRLHVIGNDLAKLHEDGCELSSPPELFRLLMLSTFGDPCTTGCSYFNNGKCPAYNKYHSIPEDIRRRGSADLVRSHSDQSGLIGGRWEGLSIRQIALEQGISLNEARRRKQAGQYRS